MYSHCARNTFSDLIIEKKKLLKQALLLTPFHYTKDRNVF